MTGDMSLVKIMQGKLSIGHSGNFEINVRSIRLQMFFKIGALKKFSGISFNKVADLKVCSFIKTRLQHRSFPVKFAKVKKIKKHFLLMIAIYQA